ncbi:peptidyl-prolyl cis-trans isomerase [Acidovorax sp. RAC01]|uniref:peptidylprolyl isomerase n=1 Tax=Acidovorax sp. RAC01 TaxID=1842533 RepID=UPI000857599E|nr:peptidylprolyl isomerase [Acidovorax sp. RAC01]AOG22297.1 PPIC-type PPIASE domain protein [Acidovorax sp. RAC01]
MLMKKMKRVACALLVSAVGCVWAQAAPAGKPLARLANGEVISEQDLSDYLGTRVDLRPVARNAWGVEGVVQEMAMTRVLVLDGERVGLPRRTGEGALKRFDDVYALATYKKLAPACEAPANEQEVRKYFDAHPQAFEVPAQARVERIILPMNAQIGGGSAMAWLQDQAQAIIQGKRPFGLVALRAKNDYSLDAQGDLGWITLDGDHLIMRALKTVKAGELLGPVQDDDFVYLFSVVQKREARQLTWEEAKSFASTRAVSHCREEAKNNVRNDVFKRYGVEIDRAAIREMVARANSAALSKSEAQNEGSGAK